MAKLRIGVVGCGSIGMQGHLPFYQAHAAVGEIFVAGSAPERRAEAAARYSKVRAGFADYREMLRAEKLDCISVCTPNHLHAPVVLAAAQHGAHVLCEKPMALNAAEARRMIAACARHDVRLMINFTHRFLRGSRKVKALLDSGCIGTPHTLRIRYVHGGPYAGTPGKTGWFYDPQKAGGGALMDMGVHAIDMCHFLLGPLARLSASVGNLSHAIPVEDHALLLAETKTGVRAVIEAGWNGAKGLSGVEIAGSEGCILMDYHKGLFVTTGTLRKGSGAGKSRLAGTKVYRERQVPCVVLADGMKLVIETFLRHVRQGTEPASGAAAGLAAVEVIGAAYQSARTGRRIELK